MKLQKQTVRRTDTVEAYGMNCSCYCGCGCTQTYLQGSAYGRGATEGAVSGSSAK